MNSNRNEDFEIEKLEPYGGTQPYSSIKLQKPLKHRTTSRLRDPHTLQVLEHQWGIFWAVEVYVHKEVVGSLGVGTTMYGVV
ncbi:hypothetical protein AMTR_s00086p00158620 [Amborella trichopoda]|uniref:Uncharacterized protein n=1 Tax=Amborella trichopoda TaxID=13333 RepID=W1P790_AMBTC|nr:hypothetical protein AMTR_s00086p00158620 [Amborella trichopoda]